MTFTIGSHLSATNGFLAMGQDALAIGANTFQFFTRNPRGGKAKEIIPDDVAAFLRLSQEHHFGFILAHASYTLNICSKDPGIRKFATATMADDLQRMEWLPGNLYNLHPGSHTGQGVETGIRQIIDNLNAILFTEQKTTVLLETMSGKGSEVGSSFEELRQILDGISLREKMGVCLDTCHIYDAGYDLVNDLDGVLAEFDRVIGLSHLKAIHLNDSINPFASRKDRHAGIGKGTLGIETFRKVINHPALQKLPFLLETPNELEGYAAEIKLLKSLREK
jgi:deoxyribonuclease-4